MSQSSSILQQAVQLHRAGKYQQAARIYQQILQHNPLDAQAMQLLGVIAFQQNQFQQSADLIERAIAIDPYRFAFHHNLGSTYRVLGRFEEARRSYRTSIDLKLDYAEAFFNLSAIHRFQADDPLIEQMEQLLERSGLSDEDRCFLHFAAGKAYDDCGDYSRAFSHFQQGNQAARLEFSADEYQRFVDEMIEVVDSLLYQEKMNQGHLDSSPIFVVGMPRSGTTLVEQILASHPDVYGAGELPDVNGIAAALAQHTTDGATYPKALRTLNAEIFRGFGKAYCKRLRSLAPQSRWIVDKNPINHQHLGLILLLLPEARIIHCRRDPLDTCLSCYFQRFRSGQEFSYSFAGIAAFYHGYRCLMDHWRNLAEDRILDVVYERVVDDLESVSKQMLAFCGIPWDERCLQFHQATRPVATASDIQVRQPIFKNRVARWKNYQAQLQPLKVLLENTP